MKVFFFSAELGVNWGFGVYIKVKLSGICVGLDAQRMRSKRSLLRRKSSASGVFGLRPVGFVDVES